MAFDDKLTSNDALKNWRLRINELIDEVNRKAYINHADKDINHGLATAENYGHVRLIDDVDAVYDSVNGGYAASPLSVKKIHDIAKNAIQNGVPVDGTIIAKTFEGDLVGNASSATMATQDGEGNVISETYATVEDFTSIISGAVTYSGSLKRDGVAVKYKDILTEVGKDASILYQSTYKGYMPALNLLTQDGRVGFGTNESLCRWDYFLSTNTEETPNTYIDLTPTSIEIFGSLNVDGVTTLNKDLNVKANIVATGDIIGDVVYNAIWNDYAEFFEKGEETEVGDFIALDESSDEEKYVKASKENPFVVGVHSNTFGHILGGDISIEDSKKTHIPVGLVGRVYAKITGEIRKGDYVVLSNIPGVGRKYYPDLDNVIDIIGGAVESSSDKNIKLVKIKLK